jgi:hypothetical protein
MSSRDYQVHINCETPEHYIEIMEGDKNSMISGKNIQTIPFMETHATQTDATNKKSNG